MKKFFRLPVAIPFLVCLTGCSFLLYKNEFEARCEKQCKVWAESYRQKYPSDSISYKSHYNKKLNQCFALVYYSKSQLKSLRNISENKIYGSFLSRANSQTVICNFMGNKCKTEQEWYASIKPYMDE